LGVPNPDANLSFGDFRTALHNFKFFSLFKFAQVLEYAESRDFIAVTMKARAACAKCGHTGSDQLARIRNLVDIGSGA
jgi:hypothetical protein